MSYKLEKPYTNMQRANFVVAHQGMKYAEDESAIYLLEEYEKVVEGSIIDISDTGEYKAEVKARNDVIKKQELQLQIDELDIKRIRAICEPANHPDGGTWLEYYTAQIVTLRAEIAGL